MTEEPRVFGEERPFTLVHGDDVKEVTHFLSQRGVEFTRALNTPSLYKLQFTTISGETARDLMRELVGKSTSPRLSTPNS